jgi:hypothetical protein
MYAEVTEAMKRGGTVQKEGTLEVKAMVDALLERV